ncbi:MAG: hypothetical protein ACKV2V_23435 [Blastocatellia bacterium]
MALLVPAFAQQSVRGQRALPDNLMITDARGNGEKNTLLTPKAAIGKDLYCAGFIAPQAPRDTMQIVGAEMENSRSRFGQGDVVYLNAGRRLQIEEGMLFSINRPRGTFRSPFKGNKEQRNLGVYVSELGVLRIMTTQENTSIARIIFSCDDIQFGDTLRAFESRPSVSSDLPQPLPRYVATSGQKDGRIVMQREMKELIGPRDVVYLDLGSDSGVAQGDKFTIFRNLPDDSRVLHYREDDIEIRRSGGFQSDTYKGGTYSGTHPYEAFQDVRNKRGGIPRTVIGELVIISVHAKSATAVITRVTQEVHTGDRIEAK